MGAQRTDGHTLSADGTRIGWRRLGHGPALVIVHGSLATGQEWYPVAEDLAADHTVFLVDRRGRGLSGDGPDYCLAAEVADLHAVLAHVGPGAALLGHSYGGICAAATASAGADIAALVLYEPPLPVNGPWDDTALPGIEKALDAGDTDLALTSILTDAMGAAGLAEKLRGTPLWTTMAGVTPTFEREFRSTNALVGRLGPYMTIPHRTNLLVGSQTIQRYKDATTFLLGSLPHARLTELPGEAHHAHLSSPRAVSQAVRSLLHCFA